jgi:Yip1-like protein
MTIQNARAMMMTMVMLSVRNPALAARQLMALNLPSRVLWLVLLLMSILNAILFTTSNLLFPVPMPMPLVFSSPFYYFGFITAGLVLSIHAIYWAGRGLGGTGSLNDIMVVMVWLQVLRVLVQAAVLVLMLVAPAMTGILAIAAALVGVYIVMHFVDQAHRLNSLGRTAFVLVVSVLAIALGLSMILALFVGVAGGNGYV